MNFAQVESEWLAVDTVEDCVEWAHKYAGPLLSRLIKERARVLELSHIRDTFRPTRFRGGKKEPNPYYGWTPADWEREAEKELRGET